MRRIKKKDGRRERRFPYQFYAELIAELIRLFQVVQTIGGRVSMRKILPCIYFFVLFLPTVALGGTRAIVVDYAFYEDLKEEIAVLKSDYQSEGERARLIIVPRNVLFSDVTSYTWVRDQLLEISDLSGAILIGNVPTAFFEEIASGDWWPSDIVYRIPSANFVDTDGDGLLESVAEPYGRWIPVGRVTPINDNFLMPEPVEQLRHFLERLHAFRNGSMVLPENPGLNFIDSPMGRGDQRPGTNAMERFYGSENVTTIVDEDYGPQYDRTNASLYKFMITKFKGGWEFVVLQAHGDPTEHTFHRINENGTDGGIESTFSSQLYRLNTTNVNVFLFSSCSTCRFVYNLGNRYQVSGEFICGSALFGQTDDEPVKTIGVIAPSTDHSFAVGYQPFFVSLVLGYNLGEALNSALQQETGISISIYQLFGDPWLKLQRFAQKRDLSVEHKKRILLGDDLYVHVEDATTTEPIVKAKVTLTRKTDGKEYAKDYTSENGYIFFNIFGLFPGVYKVTVEKDGYNTYEGEVKVEGVYLPPIPWSLLIRIKAELEAFFRNREWEDVIIIVVNVEYRLSRNWEIGLEGTRYNFKFEDSNENFHWWNVSPTIRYYLQTKKLSPFINIGPSLYIPEKGAVRIGGKIGAGIELAISKRFAFEIGADYHTIFKKSKRNLDIENMSNFLGLRVGIALNLGTI